MLSEYMNQYFIVNSGIESYEAIFGMVYVATFNMLYGEIFHIVYGVILVILHRINIHCTAV